MAMSGSGMRRGLSVFVVAACTAAALVAPGTPAAARSPQDGEGGGFVWANLPSSPPGVPYTPSPAYQYNSRSPHAAVNTVEHLPGEPGRYRVTFPGLVSPDVSGLGVPHVTAYGGDGSTCYIEAFGRTFTYTHIDVGCFSPAGHRVDGRFTASLITAMASWQGRPMAYMYAPAAGLFLRWGFNSSGAENTVTLTGQGRYEVRLPNLAAGAGHVQVTAYGTGGRCKVDRWVPDGTTQVVHVLCFDRTGNPTSDLGFFLTYVERLNLLGLSTGFDPDGHDSAYAWANRPTASDWYTPNPLYQFANSTNDAATARRIGPGDYVVKFQDVDLNTGNVQVTAYGPGTEYCGVVNWNSFAGIRVRCHNVGGVPVDTRFAVAFTGPFVVG
jgi:hypothetical protein